MKARPVLCCMMAAGAVTIVTAWVTGTPWALALAAMSFAPCLSLTGGQRLWQPWFMTGVTEEALPDLRIIAIQAAILEVLMVAGLCLHVGVTLLAFRLLGFMVQLSTLGKLSRDVGINSPTDEDSRTPTPRASSRNAGQ